MEALVFLLLLVIAVCFVLPLVAIAKATRARRSVAGFETRVGSLEGEWQVLKPARGGVSAERAGGLSGRCRPHRDSAVNAGSPALRAPHPPLPAINWEQFMGAKLFAWIGGLALFLGVAFFVKYSFERNLISPELRVAIGFAVGLALVVCGVALQLK